MRTSLVHRCSPLRTATEGLRDAFFSETALKSISAKWSEARKAGRDGAKEHITQFQMPKPNSRGKRATLTGSSYIADIAKEEVKLPTVADVQAIIDKECTKLTPPERLEKLEQFLRKFSEDAALHSAPIAPLDEAQVLCRGGRSPEVLAFDFAEVGSVMSTGLQAFRAGLESANGQFEPVSTHGKLCLVVSPLNFPLLALKDAVQMTLEGYRVIVMCQPELFPYLERLRRDFVECGIDSIDVVPGIGPEADQSALDTALRTAHRLQFTGTSDLFRSLRRRALELGNKSLVAAGDVSGINKVELRDVSISHPTARFGCWRAMNAWGAELHSSASLIEYDSALDNQEKVWKALSEVPFRSTPPFPCSAGNWYDEFNKEKFEVKMDSEWKQEWRVQEILDYARGEKPSLKTSLSAVHCIYAKSVTDALESASSSHASNVYVAGCPDKGLSFGGPSGQVPPCFSGMKTHTQAVAGDHDGVATPQQLLSPLRRRPSGYKDREEHFYEYELTDRAEDLMCFLETKEQQAFADVVSSLLEVIRAFEPKVIGPYDGVDMGEEDFFQLYSIKALRRTNLHVVVPNFAVLPEDIAKLAILWEMLPIKGGSVTLHVFMPDERITRMKDPLKSFVKCVKKLGWVVHEHHNQWEGVKNALDGPSYFVGVSDVKLLSDDMLATVIDNGGHVQEGIPAEPIALFRMLTTTQTITSIGENAVQQAAMEFPETNLRKVFIPEPLVDDFDDDGSFDSMDSSDDEPDVTKQVQHLDAPSPLQETAKEPANL